MNEQMLFQYELADAWEDTLAKVEVTDGKKDNVRCTYPCVSPSVKGEVPSAQVITLSGNEIEKIRNILMEHTEIFEIDDVEFPMILDGYVNNFVFLMGENKTCIQACNIYVYREMESVKAKKVLEVFDAIAKVLLAAGVEEKYLALERGSLGEYNEI